MRNAIFSLVALCILAAPYTLAQTADETTQLSPIPVERYYCTQYGPFFFRHDGDKMAGVFAILTNRDLGAVVGTIEERSFSGRWFEVDSAGDIKIEFSNDWTSFDAAYAIDGEPNAWRRGWVGRLRSGDSPTSFEEGGVTYRCSQ